VFDLKPRGAVPMYHLMHHTTLRRDDGFTLVELLVTMAAMLVVAGAAMTILVSLQRQAAADVERAHAIREAEQGLHRMTKELREAYAVTTRTGDEIQATIRVGAVDTVVRYNCAEPHPTLANVYRCVRHSTAGGVSHKDVVIDRILNSGTSTAAGDRVFQYPNGRPSYVRVRIWVPAAGEARAGFNHRVVLDDGIYMRNCDNAC
jgi:prepilin-type N-terminal cleavage/methylation domain-containing protein